MKELFSFEGLWLATDIRRGDLWIRADKHNIIFSGLDRICIPLHFDNLWIGLNDSAPSDDKGPFLDFTLKCGHELEKPFSVSANGLEIIDESGESVLKIQK